MEITAAGSKRGTLAEINVVPLIDVLLVLLVIFMTVAHTQTGLKVEIPQAPDDHPTVPALGVVVVEVLADGSLAVNQRLVSWESLRGELEQLFNTRADRTAFVRGDELVEFGIVARVIDVMHTAGISTVGLMTELEKGR